ncbi:MAG TPA: hypothetical protein VH478_04705 [Trebonia sp.]|jgi:hypothetical protein|nr:hypothetical protein [Trebonia sp.]
MTEEYGETISAQCPVHPDNGRIKRVSVVYAAGEPQLLRPGPVLRAANRLAWAGTALGVAGAIAIWIGTLIGHGAAGPALIAGVVCFAYALALYGWAAARRARLTVVERGLPEAMAVWQAAWYCDECDGIFFLPGALRPAPPDVVEGAVITPAAFHRLVWRAGGYGAAGRLAG